MKSISQQPPKPFAFEIIKRRSGEKKTNGKQALGPIGWAN